MPTRMEPRRPSHPISPREPSAPYEAPAVEMVVTGDQLDREAQYAGAISQK